MNQSSNIKLQIDALFSPIIRVVPTDTWSKIKAIWIPLLHHDYLSQLQRSETIKILDQQIDRFGTVQGFLTAPHENYIPYKTTFFNPIWTKNYVIEQIIQAYNNRIESIETLSCESSNRIIRKTMVGKTLQNQYIKIVLNEENAVIEAIPLFSYDNIEQIK